MGEGGELFVHVFGAEKQSGKSRTDKKEMGFILKYIFFYHWKLVKTELDILVSCVFS